MRSPYVSEARRRAIREAVWLVAPDSRSTSPVPIAHLVIGGRQELCGLFRDRFIPHWEPEREGEQRCGVCGRYRQEEKPMIRIYPANPANGKVVHYRKEHSLGETLCGITQPFNYWFDAFSRRVTCEACARLGG